jgi:hypothetical protein
MAESDNILTVRREGRAELTLASNPLRPPHRHRRSPCPSATSATSAGNQHFQTSSTVSPAIDWMVSSMWIGRIDDTASVSSTCHPLQRKPRVSADQGRGLCAYEPLPRRMALMAWRPVRSGHYEEARGPHGFRVAHRVVQAASSIPNLPTALSASPSFRNLASPSLANCRTDDSMAGLSLRIAKTHDNAWI